MTNCRRIICSVFFPLIPWLTSISLIVYVLAPDHVSQVQALACTALCSPRCTNEYRQINAEGTPAMAKHPIQGGVEILLVTACYRSWDKLLQ